MELRERIEKELLPYVNKPLRYVGNEFNQISKNLNQVKLRVALIYPDLYENSLHDPLFEIYYQLLNRKHEIAAERVCIPDLDAEEILRKKRIPLFSLENKLPLFDFDVLFFYLLSPLNFTAIFTALELSNIPFMQKDRPIGAPLIIGLGKAIRNPEPIADIFDAFLLQSPHRLMLTVVDLLLAQHASIKNRTRILENLRKIGGVYIPTDYVVSYNSFGEFEGVQATNSIKLNPDGEPDANQDSTSLSMMPLVPVMRIRQEPVAPVYYPGQLECSSGLLEPIPDEPLTVNFHKHLSAKLLNPIRYESILLLENGAHFSRLWQFWKNQAYISGKTLLLQFPAMKFLSPPLAYESFVRQSFKLPFTILIEGVSNRLRRMLNKNVREEDIVAVFRSALYQGWRNIRLVIYLGLPTEKEADLEELILLLRELQKIGRNFDNFQLSVKCMQFIPRPQSPFQWEKQENGLRFQARLERLKTATSDLNIQWIYRLPFVNELEGILGRGDRRLVSVIQTAWEKGARFGNHPDRDNSEIWESAFRTHQIQKVEYLKALSITQPLPWEHLSIRRSLSELKKLKLAALEGTLPLTSADKVCLGYSLSREQFNQLIQWMIDHPVTDPNKPSNTILRVSGKVAKEGTVQYGRRSKRRQSVEAPIKRRLRIRYAKLGPARYISHLDFIRLMDIVAARANLPLVYTQGKRPHPKMSFGPPLVTGISSVAEYMDMEILLGREMDLQNQLNKHLPPGIQILQYKSIFSKVPSIASMVNRLEYEVFLNGWNLDVAWIEEWLARSEIIVRQEDQENDEGSTINLRPFVCRLELSDDKLLLSIRKIEDRFAKVTQILESLFLSQGLDYRQFPVQRTEQYIEKDDQLLTPLDII